MRAPSFPKTQLPTPVKCTICESVLPAGTELLDLPQGTACMQCVERIFREEFPVKH